MLKREIKYVHSELLTKYADKHFALENRLNNLIRSYGLMKHMKIIHPVPCNVKNLCNFHSWDYINRFVEYNNEESADLNNSIVEEYGLGYDCPMWQGIKDYICVIAGATMTAAAELLKTVTQSKSENKVNPPVIINWNGGWHHAQRDKAGGFCYVNDIVLGILLLRKHFQRVFYIDLDAHHGNGVQEAFETTKRVFTVSFHQYECGYFPGTGSAGECGLADGKGYAVNFPYRAGITGKHYVKYFERIITQIFDRYQPDVCVLQCGADVIVGDPLGGTNLIPTDVIECIEMIIKRNLPTLVLGGGGYNIANTCRFWTLVTAALCGQQLCNDIPDNCEDFLAYGPDYTLSIPTQAFLRDHNNETDLEHNAEIIENNLNKYNVSAI